MKPTLVQQSELLSLYEGNMFLTDDINASLENCYKLSDGKKNGQHENLLFIAVNHHVSKIS